MTDEATTKQPQTEAAPEVKAEVKPDAKPEAEVKTPKTEPDASKSSDARKPNSPRFTPANRNKRPGAGGRGGRPGGRGRNDRRGPKADVPAESDYEEKNIEISRVTRVTKGGKRMRFRVLAVIGNHKGRVGFGMAKGLDVQSAMGKATTRARKALINVPITYETIPHPIRVKYGAAEIIMKPAPKGTGVKAGGPVRTTLELAGIPNITAKILGTTNKVSNVKAVFKALAALEAPKKKAKEGEKPEVSETETTKA
ncbi:MAG: 30S ribosomal protein S5 [Patescibacteria group bacterium]|nr:30S ribosomal protein S5 [Patescibacteria group bacterium]